MIKGVYEEGKKESEVFLRLEETGGTVRVLACNEIGEELEQGILLEISKETGKVYFHTSVSPKFGFGLDGERCLISTKVRPRRYKPPIYI